MWTVELPAGMELLNANQRLHWAAKARITKGLRDGAFILAKKAKIPALDMVCIVGEYQPPTNAKRDAANLYPSFKACIDGLVDAGVIVDDDDAHLTGPFMRTGTKTPGGRLVLRIYEWSAEQQAAMDATLGPGDIA